MTFRLRRQRADPRASRNPCDNERSDRADKGHDDDCGQAIHGAAASLVCGLLATTSRLPLRIGIHQRADHALIGHAEVSLQFRASSPSVWIAGSGPAMTKEVSVRALHPILRNLA